MIIATRKPWRAFGALIILLIGLTGCGGGSGPTFVNKPVTDAARSAALDAIDAQSASLAGQSEDARLQALAAFMKTQSEFEDAGVASDGSAWGRFTDGRLAIIVRNRENSGTARSAALSKSARGRAASGLPASNKVRFYDTMGPAYHHPAQGIQDQLSVRGYNPAQLIVSTGTVAELKLVQGDGIFYIDAHGGIGHERGAADGNVNDNRKIFCIWTATKRTLDSDQQSLSDLQSNRLVYMKGLVDRQNGNRIEEWHYGITPAFVGAYMHFGANSLVYIDACSSDNPGFKAACINAGAGLYVGWSTATDDAYSTPTVQFFFDRMLGTDAVAPIDPSNPPPMDWAGVKTAMSSTLIPGTQVHYGHSPSVDSTKYPDADLTFTAGQGDLGVIVPSITSVGVPDFNTKNVTLFGLFGNKQGTAFENATDTSPGNPLTVVSWSPTQVVVKITDTTQTVRLSVDGRTSNIATVPASSAKIDPTSVTLLNNAQQTFHASTDAQLDPGASLAYHWSTTGQHGLLSDSNGHVGVSFDTTANQALYTANPSGTGDDTVTVEIFQVLGNQRKSLGPAVATVTVADAVQQVSLTLTNIDPTLQGALPTQVTIPAYGVVDEQYNFRDGKNIVSMIFTADGSNNGKLFRLALPFTGDLTSGMQISAVTISDFFPEVVHLDWQFASYISQSGTVKITSIGGPIVGGPFDRIVAFTLTVHMVEIAAPGATPRTFDLQAIGACEVDNLNNPQGRTASLQKRSARAKR